MIRQKAAMTPVVVHWSAPAECPSQAVVEEQVARLVDPAASLEADVVVTAVEGGFRARLRVRGGGSVGERSLEGESCAELARSTAVVLALSAAKLPDAAPPPPPPPVVPAPLLGTAPPRPPRVVRAPAPPSRVPSHPFLLPEIRLLPFASVDVGTLPSPAFGGGLGIYIVPVARLSVGLEGMAWASETVTAPTITGQGARLQPFAADAVGCFALLRGTLELSPCAVVEVTTIAARGVGESPPKSPTATWVSVGAGLRARLGLGRRLALALGVEGLVPTEGQTFQIEVGSTGTPFYSIGPAALRVDLGPELRF
jgi:hypothetical protein